MKELLTVNGIRKCFNGRPALDNVSLKLESGKIYGLLGPNGSGKTTLIKLINGLLVPDAGNIYVNNDPLGINSKAVISYLPEKLYFSPWMKVSYFLEYYQDFYPDFDLKRANDMLERLAINKEAVIKSLSKGTKEKLQLILVMSRRASLYILDEPIGGVDPAARDYILDTIIDNYDENATILLSTHLIYDIEKKLDEVIFLKNGHIVLMESVEDIRQHEEKSVDELFREVFRC